MVGKKFKTKTLCVQTSKLVIETKPCLFASNIKKNILLGKKREKNTMIKTNEHKKIHYISIPSCRRQNQY